MIKKSISIFTLLVSLFISLPNAIAMEIKSNKALRACDLCRERHVRCDNGNPNDSNNHPCLNCHERGELCKFSPRHRWGHVNTSPSLPPTVSQPASGRMDNNLRDDLVRLNSTNRISSAAPILIQPLNVAGAINALLPNINISVVTAARPPVDTSDWIAVNIISITATIFDMIVDELNINGIETPEYFKTQLISAIDQVSAATTESIDKTEILTRLNSLAYSLYDVIAIERNAIRLKNIDYIRKLLNNLAIITQGDISHLKCSSQPNFIKLLQNAQIITSSHFQNPTEISFLMLNEIIDYLVNGSREQRSLDCLTM